MTDDIEIADPIDYVLMDTLARTYLQTKPQIEASVDGNTNTADETTQSLFSTSLVQIIAYLTEVKFREEHFSEPTKEAVAIIRKAISDQEILLEAINPTHLH